MDNSSQFKAELQSRTLAEVLKAKGLASSLAEAEEMANNIKSTSQKIDSNETNRREQTIAPEVLRDSVEDMLRQFAGQLQNQLSTLNQRTTTIETQMDKIIEQLNLVISSMNAYFSSTPQHERPQPTVSQPLSEQQGAQQAQFTYTEAPQQEKKQEPRGMQQNSNGHSNANASYDKNEYDITKYFYSGPKND